MPIDRRPLGEQVHTEILRLLLSGEFPAASRLSDAALAERLGVSRTPVREALLRLVREGLLEADLHRGFFVRSLRAREAREVYPILWTLEGLAVRSGAPYPPARLVALQRLRRELEAPGVSPEERVELDLRWHEALAEGCRNERLLQTIAPLRAVARRYEHAYWSGPGASEAWTPRHEPILRALAVQDLDAAVAHLEGDWRAGLDAVARWLDEAETVAAG